MHEKYLLINSDIMMTMIIFGEDLINSRYYVVGNQILIPYSSAIRKYRVK